MFNTMKYARKIRQYAKNEIYLQYKEKKPDKYFSKLGGKPLVPKDFAWPYYTGEDFDGIVEERPLTLVASINLEEASFLTWIIYFHPKDCYCSSMICIQCQQD